MTFCRRRPGEIERLKIAEFRSYEELNETTNAEIFESLSPENQAVAKKNVRFLIRGKKARTVPVILSAALVEAFELILKHRVIAGVPEVDPYVFGIPGSSGEDFKYVRCCPLMRQYAEESGVANPETIRATTLQKHAATDAIAQDLSDKDVMLAEFMGHVEKVHKEHHRQPVIVRDVVKMAKFLEIALNVTADGAKDSDSDTSDGDDSPNRETETPLKRNKIMERKLGEEENYCPNERQKDVQNKIQTGRNAWTRTEKSIVIHAFPTYFNDKETKKLPSLKAIKQLVAENPCLQNRTVSPMKTWMHYVKKTETAVANLLKL